MNIEVIQLKNLLCDAVSAGAIQGGGFALGREVCSAAEAVTRGRKCRTAAIIGEPGADPHLEIAEFLLNELNGGNHANLHD